MMKLSKQQKAIPIFLLDAEKSAMSRQAFTQNVMYRHYFGVQRWTSESLTSSISRAYRRLEANGLIIRANLSWQLTSSGNWVAQREFFKWLEEEEKRKKTAAKENAAN